MTCAYSRGVMFKAPSHRLPSKFIFSRQQPPKKHPFNIRLNSDDPCPPCIPWII